MASWEETGAWLLFAVPNPASCMLAITEAVYVVTGSAAWEKRAWTIMESPYIQSL